MQTSIIRLPKVKAKTGLSRSTIYAKVRDGTFPKPMQLGARAVGWSENAVDIWINSLTTKGTQ